jgi:hypothetical protein
MSKHILLVLANAVEGRDADFNNWYSNQHLADVLKVPGIVSAQRFKYVAPAGATVDGPDPKPSHKYIAIYEVDSEDPRAVQAAMISRIGTDDMIMTDTMDTARSIGAYFAPITPKMTPSKSK